MIGRIRAAWDDSRRAANTRRGTNPMSREEWFELQDRIANLVTGESMSIHLTDYRRHIERCIESQFRLHEARTRSDEPLTRSDVEAIAFNAAGDLIGKAFLGSTSPTAPDTNSRTVTGVLHADDGDGIVREWNPETYEHNATRRTGMTPILGDGPITRAEATAIGAEIKEKLDELLAAKYAGVLPGLASGGGVWRSAGSELDDERSARADEENDVAQVASDCVRHGLSGADDLSGGIHDVLCSINRYLERLTADMDDRAGGIRHRHFDARARHSDSSPSADDGGAHSVGEGEVAGVETAAPVTDATHQEALASALRDRIAHDEHMLAIVHLFGLAVRGDDATRDAAHAFIAANQHLRFKLTDHAKQGGKCTVDDLGVRLTITDPRVESVDGFECDGGFLRNEMHDGLHDSSPSVGDALEQNAFDGTVEIWIHPPDGGTPEWRTVQSPRFRLR